jgi:hypothetical protein
MSPFHTLDFYIQAEYSLPWGTPNWYKVFARHTVWCLASPAETAGQACTQRNPPHFLLEVTG